VFNKEDKPLLRDTSFYVLLPIEKSVEKDQLSETCKYGQQVIKFEASPR